MSPKEIYNDEDYKRLFKAAMKAVELQAKNQKKWQDDIRKKYPTFVPLSLNCGYYRHEG